mmetsp:Transcript_108322/g.132164  ORF Transcript_108322/g.132164 Transcript_108322/m.132164 type:complete len:272 (-) Transcript_108322:22-837(-)
MEPLLGHTLQAVVQFLDGDLAIFQGPGFVAHFLNEVHLRLNHQDTTSEVVQRLGQSLHGFHVQVVRGLIDCDEVRLGPKHGRQRQSHLLSSRKTTDLLIAAHLLINTKTLAVLHDLSSRQGPLVQARGLGGDALVAGDDHLVQTHISEGLQGHHGVLLGIIQAFPSHLIVQLTALLGSRQQLTHGVSILAILLGQGGTFGRLLVVLRLDQTLLQLLIIAIFEALGDVVERRSVEVRTQGLQVVLFHVCHSQVAVSGDLAQLAILVLSRIHL